MHETLDPKDNIVYSIYQEKEVNSPRLGIA